MANKYLDYNGLALFKQKLDGLFATQAVVNGKIRRFNKQINYKECD